MPYYVYAVKAFAQLEKLAEFDTFAPASAHAKSLRTTAAGSVRIKVMFADNPLAAEDLLLQVRQPGPSGDE
ncbi:MAG: hypothetical protein Q8N44_14550 [Rubrivivax sp.]|nr:hypothetical protein [Rubrivivax sp.]MDP3084891.1 hypothetical protein [Rubrivivax sp.]